MQTGKKKNNSLVKALLKIRKNVFLDWSKQKKIDVFAIFIIIIVSFFLYYKSINFGYTYLDDTQLLLNRKEFLRNIGNIFKSFEKNVFYLSVQNSHYYRPILTVSFILDTVFFGDNVMVYHLVNILLHIISSVILFYLLKKILRSQKISFFLTILFVAHPSLMQGVVWIPGRNDVLLAIFSLLSFNYFFNLVKNRDKKNMFFFIFFFLLALYTKETAFLLPFIFIFYLVLFLKGKFVKKDYLLFFFIMFLIPLFAFLSRILVLSSNGFRLGEIVVSLKQSTFWGILFYLGKVFYPVHLGVTPILRNKIYWSGIVSIVFLSFLVLTTEKSKRRYSYFGIFWFGVLLLPVFINTRYFDHLMVFEHRLYLPLFGILLVLGSNRLFRKIVNLKFSYFILIAYLLFSFWVVKNHIDYFKDGISFWEKAYKDNPKDTMNSDNLGLIYLKSGKYEDAIKMYEMSLDNHVYGTTLYNIGLAYASMGKYKKARNEFEKGIKLLPNSPWGYFGLAKLCQEEKKFKEAEENYLKVIEIAPDSVKAYMNLAIIYVHEGRMEEAVKMYAEVKKRGVEY